MRKTLLALGTMAALVASAGGAFADPVTITFDGACNSVTLTQTSNNVSATFGGDACAPGLGTGYNGKIKHTGNGTAMAVRFNSDTASYYLILATPYVTGQSWLLYKTTDGLTTSSTTGTYTVKGTPEAHPSGAKSITSFLR